MSASDIDCAIQASTLATLQHMPKAQAAPIVRGLQTATEEGDCLLWHRLFCNGSPQVVVNQGDGRRMKRMVRRLLLEAHQAHPLRKGTMATTTCGNPRCVRIEHIRAATRKQIARALAARGALPSEGLRRMRIIDARRKQSRLTWADIDLIRNSPCTCKDLAVQLGVSRSTCSLIRSGKTWRAPVGGWALSLAGVR